MDNQMKLDLSSAPWMTCECGGHVFNNSMMLKRVSSLISPTGKEELVPVEIIVCDSCKKIPGFISSKIPGLPGDLKTEKKS